MKTNLTELVFILDRSGSMGGLESDTIGGFNSMLTKQQSEPGECRITTVLFDNYYEILHDRIHIKAVKPITDKEYFVRGGTALLDAVGTTINKLVGVQRNTAKKYQADKVLFVITTDGLENASCEFRYSQIKDMIKLQEEKYGWEFVFLGANINAAEVAGHLGIKSSHAQNYHNDSEGIALNYATLSDSITFLRKAPKGTGLHANWSAKIQKNFEKRSAKK